MTPCAGKPIIQSKPMPIGVTGIITVWKKEKAHGCLNRDRERDSPYFLLSAFYLSIRKMIHSTIDSSSILVLDYPGLQQI